VGIVFAGYCLARWHGLLIAWCERRELAAGAVEGRKQRLRCVSSAPWAVDGARPPVTLLESLILGLLVSVVGLSSGILRIARAGGAWRPPDCRSISDSRHQRTSAAIHKLLDRAGWTQLAVRGSVPSLKILGRV